MGVWNWVWEYTARVNREKDPERKRLRPLIDQGSNQHGDPDQHLAILKEGRALAEKLGERWWVLLFDHWRIQKFLYHKRNFKAALDLSVRSVVEARKPVYTNFPQRVCLHEDLINAYIGIDPAGNAGQIEQSIGFMEQEVGPDMECRFCLQSIKIDFALELNRLNEAETFGAAFIASSQEGSFYNRANAYHASCKIAFARKNWTALLALADEGERLAKKADHSSWQLEFQACRVLATLNLGERRAAEKLYFLVANGSRRSKDTPSAFFYDVVNSYLEGAGKTEEALRLRQQQLTELRESGQLTNEVRCRVEICRKLSDNNKLEKAELEAARDTASKLANPSPYLAELAGLEN